MSHGDRPPEFEVEAPGTIAAPAPGAVPMLPASGRRPPSLSPQGILALQRTAGNATVTRALASWRLQRYQVEGPVNWNDPVHEVLTLRAIADALDQVKKRGGKPGTLLGGVKADKLPLLSSPGDHNIAPENTDKSVQQFLRGVIWPDDPKGLFFDQPQGTNDYSSGKQWYGEYLAGKKGDQHKPEDLTGRSHFGDLQFLHGMASKDGEAPADTKKHAQEWAAFLGEVATGRLSGDTPVGDVEYAKKLFPAQEKLTIKALFGNPKASDVDIQQRAAGAMLHLIQDSHAEGHVDRDPKTGEVREFHAYGGQDEDKHTGPDEWAAGKTLGDRIKNTPGAARALEKSAELLELLDRGASADEVQLFFESEIYSLQSGAKPASAGKKFEKEKTK